MTHLDKLDGIKKKKTNANSIADFLETTDDYKIRNEKGGKHVILICYSYYCLIFYNSCNFIQLFSII